MVFTKGDVCSAINCSNNRKKSAHTSFFRFPKDPERSKKWLVNLRRKDLLQKDTIYLHANIRLCANHFELSQFMNTDRKRLIWNAVPTLFDIPNKPPQVTPQRKLTMRCPLPQAKKLTMNIVKKQIEEVIIKKEIKEEIEIEEYEVAHADLEEMSVKVETEHSLDSVSWKPFIGNSVWGDEEGPTQLFNLFSIEEHGASKSAIKEEKDVENGMILKQENSALKYPSVKSESNECLNSSLESAHHRQDDSSVGKIYLDQFHTSGNNLEHLCLKCGVEIDNSFYQNSRTSVVDTQISSLLNDSSCLQEKYEEKSKLQSRKKLYRCKHCKINLPHNSLKRHAAQEHGDLKPFCCVTCSSQFSSQAVLKRHAVTHSKVRDFCCEVCGKTFGYRGTLKTHMFMHNWTVT